MERYCILDEETIKNIDIFKWKGNKDFKELSLFEIYKQMLEAYYLPISIFELHRMIIGETNEEIFLKQINLKKSVSDGCKVLDINKDVIDSGLKVKILKRDDISEKDDISDGGDYTPQDNSFYGINYRNNKSDNVVQNIIRNQIIIIGQTGKKEKIEKASEHFYYDILQALLYSLRYYLGKGIMIYLNPFQEDGKENNDRKDFVESWNQFKRKGADSIRRGEKKTKRETIDIKMLSDFAVEVPLDTKVEIMDRNVKISEFAADVIRFFIEKDQKEGRSKYTILDLFSKKRRDRFTPSDYTKLNIKAFLNKFKRYSSNSDNIIEQFLLEQCFGLDISEYVYDFIESVIFTDKIVKKEVKNYLSNRITNLVRGLRSCEPMLSKKLVLNATAMVLRQCPQSLPELQETHIRYACLRLEQAVQIEQELIIEMNHVYKELSKYFFYALFYSSDGDLARIDKMLCDEIKRVKEELEKENKEEDRIEDIEKKGYDIFFPYIQKAMMVER